MNGPFSQYLNKAPTADSRIQWCTYDINKALTIEIMKFIPFFEKYRM